MTGSTTMDPNTQAGNAAIRHDDDEAALVQRAARGEEAAFTAIMRRYNQLLFRSVRSILKSDADAEDALQEAWLQAWRALGAFRADARLSTWLVRIAINEALGRQRRTSAQIIALEPAMNLPDADRDDAFADDPAAAPEQKALRAQLRRLIEARIDELPASFRTVFMLRAVEELSVEEVAQALGIPAATVRTRLFRARSLIREGLASQIDLATADAFAFDGVRCDCIVAGVLARARASGLCDATS
ncbi:RNA polymerase sigma factor [Dokdonella sp.]|uniref:RNA polymerase sigma factor n=1 Tax=Dokdonella sp. TaxID=2291710 RepID=UPI0027B8A093|nr:RNA polymerase sigma factor [Dokdonella sp.]